MTNTAPFDTDITDRLLATTRAVRRRLDLARPVERQTILDCIALSQQAPTASNTQTWHWLVVTDPDKKAQLAQLYASGSPALVAAREGLGEGDAQTHRVYDSAEYLLDVMAQVPALVIPCVQGRVATDAHLCVQASIFGSIFPAVWNFQLALRSRGLGSVLTTLHLLREEEVAQLLGIPEDVMQVALLPVAYTLGTDFKRADRPPPESITHFEAW
ncbi:MAG: nitroreductase family protein [Halioglobus sp.]|nr:nitroreductase family protein [Halioglobus sp.]